MSWLFLLLVAVGAAWYFLGEKYLPTEYTFPSVWERIRNWWSQPASKVPNPADAKTASERARMKEFLKQLERLCASSFPKRTEAIGIKTEAWPIGQAMLNEIVSADNWYFKANEKLAEMKAQNEKLEKLRTEERGTKRGDYVNQYGPHEINRQRNEVDRTLESCTRIRVQAVERAIKAIKATSSQWTGPESRKDAAQLLKRLDNLATKFKDKK